MLSRWMSDAGKTANMISAHISFAAGMAIARRMEYATVIQSTLELHANIMHTVHNFAIIVVLVSRDCWIRRNLGRQVQAEPAIVIKCSTGRDVK